MATAEKIYVGIDGERVELTGADLTAFKAQRTKDQAEAKAIQAEADARVAARESALAKLAALGLTEQEIAAL
jgi:DNA-binding NarL/FixJ family response regulator